MDTGAAGASDPAALRSGVALIRASHSLRVMLFLQSDGREDSDLFEIDSPSLFGLVRLQLPFGAVRSDESGVLVVSQIMDRDVFDGVVRVVDQMDDFALSVGGLED